MRVLLLCMSLYQMCPWCLLRLKEKVSDSLELELKVVVCWSPAAMDFRPQRGETWSRHMCTVAGMCKCLCMYTNKRNKNFL